MSDSGYRPIRNFSGRNVRGQWLLNMISNAKLRAATLVGLISLSGCGSDTSQPDVAPAPIAARWAYSTKVSHGSAITCVPLPPTEPRDETAAEVLLRELFQKIADDPESQKLLSRSKVYGQLPVEVVALDGAASFDEDAAEAARPETEGPAVLLLLHIEQPGSTRTYDGELAETYGYRWAYSTTFSFARVIRQSEGAANEPAGLDAAFAQLRQQDDRELIYAVANDYLLRRSPGWQVMFQGGDLPFRRPCTTPTELEAEVKRRLPAVALRAAHEE